MSAEQEELRRIYETLLRIEERLDGLPALMAGEWPGMPEECRAHECSYYRHYLAYGPADLTHEGFHAAEEKCADAQKACEAKHECDEVEGRRYSEGACCNIAHNWERRIRA